MALLEARRNAIAETLDHVRAAMTDGATSAALDAARAHMLDLASRRELFPRSDFPLPEEGSTERHGNESRIYRNARREVRSQRPD